MPTREATTATTVAAAKNANGVIVRDQRDQRGLTPTDPEKRGIRVATTVAAATTGAGETMV
jgi:hypothetical protein